MFVGLEAEPSQRALREQRRVPLQQPFVVAQSGMIHIDHCRVNEHGRGKSCDYQLALFVSVVTEHTYMTYPRTPLLKVLAALGTEITLGDLLKQLLVLETTHTNATDELKRLPKGLWLSTLPHRRQVNDASLSQYVMEAPTLWMEHHDPHRHDRDGWNQKLRGKTEKAAHRNRQLR